MSHFTVLIPANDEDDLRQKLLPYHEYGWGDGDADAEADALGYIVFEDMTDELTEEYTTSTIEVVKLADGTLKSPYDKMFDTPDAQNPMITKKVYPENSQMVEVIFNEFYDSLDEFAKDYHGYGKVKGRYGYYHNPNAKWDWYQVGGRWTGTLKLKRNGVSLPEFKMIQKDQELVNKLIFIKRNMPESYEPLMEKLKEEHGADQVDQLERYLAAIMQTYKLDNSGYGHPGVMTEPSFDIDTADYAPAGSIDWDGMKRDQLKSAEDAWDEFEKVFKLSGEDLREWVLMTQHEEWNGRREMYVRIEKWFSDHLDEPEIQEFHRDGLMSLTFFDPLGTSKDEHMRMKRLSALTFAFIDLDGKWNERGSMGWFGIHDKDDPDYDRAFWEFVDTIPDEQIVYVVDCHI